MAETGEFELIGAITSGLPTSPAVSVKLMRRACLSSVASSGFLR